MSFFHFCLLDRDCWPIEVKDLRMAILRVGKWQTMIRLPGHRKVWTVYESYQKVDGRWVKKEYPEGLYLK